MTPALRGLLQRGAIAVAPVACMMTLSMFTGESYWMLFAIIPSIGGFALVVSPWMSQSAGDGLAEFLYRPSVCDKPRAPLAQVDKLMLNGEWDAADLLLREAANRYPDDAAVWQRLFKVVWCELRDVERATEAHALMLEVVDDTTAWPRLSRLYLLFAEDRLGLGPELGHERTAVARRVSVAWRARGKVRRARGAFAAWAR